MKVLLVVALVGLLTFILLGVASAVVTWGERHTIRWYRLLRPRYVCAFSCGFRSLWWSRMVHHYDGNCPKADRLRMVMDRPPRVLDGHR